MDKAEIDEIIARSVAESKGQGKWHRPRRDHSHTNQVRTLLNTLFMLGFVAAIVIYFLMPSHRLLFFIVGFGAMVLKIVEFIVRFKS